MRRPDPFTVVKQPSLSRVCGAAVCAMAVGKTLEQVLAEKDWRQLTHTCGIAEYLAKHGITMGLYFNSVDPTKGTFSASVGPQGHPAILSVLSAVYDEAEHWIFWDGFKFMDSSVEQESYDIIETFFLHYWFDWPNPPYMNDLPENGLAPHHYKVKA
jgi:hypothetical protein